jgi:hypothetical protein
MAIPASRVNEKTKRGGERERRVGLKKEEERFLSPRADAFAGANAEEKVGPLRSK